MMDTLPTTFTITYAGMNEPFAPCSICHLVGGQHCIIAHAVAQNPAVGGWLLSCSCPLHTAGCL